MRKLMVGAAVATHLGTASVAAAADIYEGSLKDTVAPMPVAMWAGCYFGGHAGAAWQDDGEIKDLKKTEAYSETFESASSLNTVYLAPPYEHKEDDDASFIGGAHARL